MSLPLKIGVGTLTVGTVASVGYFGSPYLMNNKEKPKEELGNNQQQVTTIENLIEKNFEYMLLDTDENSNSLDKAYWAEAWNRYKQQNTSDADVFKLDGWTTRGDKDLTDKLKAKCKELSTSTNDADYENVTKYCARGVTVAEDAMKNNLTVLDISHPSGDGDIWTEKYNNRVELKSDLEKLSITTNPSSEKEIREGCEAAKSKNKQTEKYQEFYNAYTKVCTKPREESR